MAFRLRGLAAAGALTVPAALLATGALTALLPAAAAQAAPARCTADETTITFSNGTTRCLNDGYEFYPASPQVVQVCAGHHTFADLYNRTGLQVVRPGDCAMMGPNQGWALVYDVPEL